MPVDIKWIRSSPDTIKAWQKLRGLDVKVVDDAKDADAAYRSSLATLTRSRGQLKQKQQELRKLKTKMPEQGGDVPSVAPLKQDVKSLQQTISQLEAECQSLSSKTKEAVDKVASQVDENVNNVIPNMYQRDMDDKERPKMVSPKGLDFQLNIGLDISEALYLYTRQRFGHYGGETEIKNASTIDRSILYSMIGCTGDKEDDLQSSTNINEQYLWAQLLLTASSFGKKKSIYGAKTLPQYSTIYNRKESIESSNYQVTALTAGTVVDSRNVQGQLLDDYLDYIRSLQLITEDESSLEIQALSYEDLDHHELSRIEVLIHGHVVGSISNWGDAATRHCGMEFAGGGSRASKTKDYVHVVTLSFNHDVLLSLLASSQTNIEGHICIPRVLSGYMRRRSDMLGAPLETINDNYIAIPLKKNQSLFQQKSKAIEISEDTPTISETKAPREEETTTTTSTPSRAAWREDHIIRAEALSCPFEFIFADTLNRS